MSVRPHSCIVLTRDSGLVLATAKLVHKSGNGTDPDLQRPVNQ